MIGKSITVLANAKINLTLDIVGKRTDGYHGIDSVMQSVSLFDKLELILTDGKTTVSTNLGTIENEDNLVYKAVILYFKTAGLTGGADVKIIKNIPLAAGLGGGSADAAAVLLALNKLNNNRLDEKELYSLALSLGADVPFCLLGGTARARGVGELLTPLPFIGCYSVVLVKCGSKSSTKEMYDKIDSCLERRLKLKSGLAVKAIENGQYDVVWQNVSNAFLDVSPNKEEMNKMIDYLLTNGAVCSSLSGSGPSVFGIFSDESVAISVFEALKLNENEAYFCITEKIGIKNV